MKSGDDEQMRHAGAREGLPQRFLDIALITDYQRAHLGVCGIGEVAIEEAADVGSYGLDLARRKAGVITPDLKERRAQRLALRRDGCVDAVARHQADVVELAGVAVVAREVDVRSQLDVLAELEVAASEHRDPDVTAGRGHGCTLFGGLRDLD